MEVELEQRTLDAEDSHWWYRGRLRVVMDAVRRSLPRQGGRPRILDAGCGGGATLVELAGLGEPVGLEPSPLSRAKAAGRGVAEVVDGSVEELPFGDASFDVALLLDVLEHLEDESAALEELRRVVAPGGSLVITVPANPRLWSRHDELNHHYRRYTREALLSVARSAGWDPVRATYFVTLVLPVALAARRLDSAGDGLGIPPAPLNRTLRATIDAEAGLIRRGVSLPAGLSLLGEFRRR